MTPTPEQIEAERNAASDFVSDMYGRRRTELVRLIATALATARLEERNKTLRSISVSKAMVNAAQAAYEHDYEYGLTDEDMKNAIQSALKAIRPQAQGQRR